MTSKALALVLLVLLMAVTLTGCSLALPSNVEIQVTPALTPIMLADAATPAEEGEPAVAPPADASPSGPELVIAGVETGDAERTPIVIKVPLTPISTPTPTPEPVAQEPTLPAESESVAEVTPATPTQEPPAQTATPVSLPTPIPVSTDETEAPEASDESPHGVPVSLDDTLNILVVGSDERHPGRPWRSDVIMVVAVDYANRQIGVVSFPRDLWVEIPTIGENRINTATFFGGAYHYPDGGDIGLLKATLAQNFGIRIDHYAKFNFETFKDVIDALDGIDIVVDCPITGRFPVEPGSKQLVWQTLEPGQYHMDGEFALRYVRERKTTSDVDRNRRQQRVLIAMRKRAKEVNIVPRLPALYDALRDNIDTDLSLTDIIALARLGLQINTKDVHGFNIGYKEVSSWRTPGGAAVLRPDMVKIQEGLRTLFIKPSILKNPTKPRACR